MPTTFNAARDMLFAVLALQNGLIDQAQLVAAFQAWARDKSRSMADHLEFLGGLEADDRLAVEVLVSRHLKKHGGDPQKSLASLGTRPSTVETLAGVGDADIDATLAQLRQPSALAGNDADRTGSFTAGTPTSDRQRFRILRPHSRGGLGAVFVALDCELHREVALKQILEEHADDTVSRNRFVLEAEITGGLEHPGIVPVYGLGIHGDGRPYYAMRFIRGESFKDAIDKFHSDESLRRDPGQRSLELRKLLRSFLDVCNAIHYAHSRGVLHRDIKPANIIVGKHGETLVVDWGLAKATGTSDPGLAEQTVMPRSAGGSSETLPGSVMGTPAYMSPEQARGDLDALGPRSDVYSLGATIYCLLTGKPPFERGDVFAILQAVGKGDFPPPRHHDPSIDRALEAVCLKAMALAPAARYASARELADDVERWAADEPVSARREPVVERVRRWGRQHRTAMTATVALLVTALIASTLAAVLISREQTRTASERNKSEAYFALARRAVDEQLTKVSDNILINQPGLQSLRAELLGWRSGSIASSPAWAGTILDGQSSWLRPITRWDRSRPRSRPRKSPLSI